MNETATVEERVAAMEARLEEVLAMVREHLIKCPRPSPARRP